MVISSIYGNKIHSQRPMGMAIKNLFSSMRIYASMIENNIPAQSELPVPSIHVICAGLTCQRIVFFYN